MKSLPPGEVKVKLNLNARFFWEDLPYGLVILKNIGDIVGVPTPNIVRNIRFHQEFMPVKYVDEKGDLILEEVKKSCGAPIAYGIETIDQLVSTSYVASGSKTETRQFFNSSIYFRPKL